VILCSVVTGSLQGYHAIMIFDATKPALVIVDVQQAIDDPAWGPRNNPTAEDIIATSLSQWRAANLPVFHVRHDSLDPASPYRPGQPGNQFKPAALPIDGEKIVAKQTNSAFINTDLSTGLDSEQCDAVVFCGVLTNNSVEATVRMSGNLGYRSFVIADACWSVDKTDARGTHWPAEDVHQLSLANLSEEYATIISSSDLTRYFGNQPCLPETR